MQENVFIKVKKLILFDVLMGCEVFYEQTLNNLGHKYDYAQVNAQDIHPKGLMVISDDCTVTKMW